MAVPLLPAPPNPSMAGPGAPPPLVPPSPSMAVREVPPLPAPLSPSMAEVPLPLRLPSQTTAARHPPRASMVGATLQDLPPQGQVGRAGRAFRSGAPGLQASRSRGAPPLSTPIPATRTKVVQGPPLDRWVAACTSTAAPAAPPVPLPVVDTRAKVANRAALPTCTLRCRVEDNPQADYDLRLQAGPLCVDFPALHP